MAVQEVGRGWFWWAGRIGEFCFELWWRNLGIQGFVAVVYADLAIIDRKIRNSSATCPFRVSWGGGVLAFPFAQAQELEQMQ